MSNKGILYIVATPIGNLGDISARAIEILHSVTKIAAEDTRHSKPLLQKLGIETALISYHDFSTEEAANSIIKELILGNSIALISDAGTPLISDPGFKLVRLARKSEIQVFPVPGASAVTAALSVAGLPTDRFVFEGFLPSKSSARQKRLFDLIKEERTCVVFESTHRIVECLQDMKGIFPPQKQLFIAREISKKFETHYLGSAADCLQWLESDKDQQKGEFVLVFEGCDAAMLEEFKQETALKIVSLLGDTLSTKDTVALACELSGARKNLLYEKVLAGKS
ncbi:MAG: 16S rRNA (cytidine(1402)-2'-O)-methyltransferase [Pseudomonadales bacterium]|nr:16S rRNA (cytidine(1402)-2'-O)-methyltransferase [Pseudomonadales bacterium]